MKVGNWVFKSDRDDLQAAERFLRLLRQVDISEDELPEIHFQSNLSDEEYLKIVGELKEHIHKGDIYEINYCIDFFAKRKGLDPGMVFLN